MAATSRVSLDAMPARKVLPDGSSLLAEASAYRVLETAHTGEGGLTQHGGLVAPAQLRLLRRKDDGHVRFDLEVAPTEAGGKEAVTVPLDARASLEPRAVADLKRGRHVVKPEGEGLVRAALTSGGEDVELVVFEVKRSPENALLGAVSKTHVALGFADASEARGWHLYLSAVLGVVDEAEGKTFEAMCAKAGAAGHEAANLGPLYSGLAA